MPVVIGTGTESPSQRARSELANEIASYVLMSSSTRGLAVCALAINDAIRKLNTRTWEWSTTYQDITPVAGTADYDMSSDLMAPRSVWLLNGSSKPIQSGMSYFDPKEFVEMYADRSVNGTPEAYTVFNSHDTLQLTFNCPVSSGFVTLYPTVRFRYYRRTPYLTSDSDVLDAPSEVESFVTWHGCWYMATRFDPAKAALAKQEAAERWKMLVFSEQRILTTDWAR